MYFNSHEQPQIKIIQYHINRRNAFQIERFTLHRFRQDRERDVIVGGSEPGKDEIEELVHHLDVDPRFTFGGGG